MAAVNLTIFVQPAILGCVDAHMNEEHYSANVLEDERKLAMRTAFLAYKEERTAKLREVLKDVPAGEPLVLMVVNYGQLLLFLN
eukprot:jgi/Tetstr1/459308/TSEL_004703.t1